MRRRVDVAPTTPFSIASVIDDPVPSFTTDARRRSSAVIVPIELADQRRDDQPQKHATSQPYAWESAADARALTPFGSDP